MDNLSTATSSGESEQDYYAGSERTWSYIVNGHNTYISYQAPYHPTTGASLNHNHYSLERHLSTKAQHCPTSKSSGRSDECDTR